MAPSLSALLVVGVQRARGERCLAALLAQTAIAKLEIVVVDIAPAAGPLRGADSPNVRVIPFPQGAGYPAARAECVRQSRAPYVAFLEDHVVPEPGWAEAVLSAFARGAVIVNYAFVNANPKTYVSRACLVAEYGPWMAPARSGPIRYLSGNNIAYARAALEPFLDRLGVLLESEFVLQRAILAAGGSAWLEAGAVIAHENWVKLGIAMRSNGAIKRLLAARRATLPGWGAARRVLYAGGMVLSPGLHLLRLLRGAGGRGASWVRIAGALP